MERHANQGPASPLSLHESRKIQYWIMRNGGPEGLTSDRKLRNLVYSRWWEIWRDVYRKVGRDDAISADGFFRQHLLVCLTAGASEPIGFHLYTFFDLDALADLSHSYFHGVTDISMARLRRLGMKRVMSMEYLTVTPEWRKHESGIPWGDVLVALGQRVMETSGFDASLGMPRVDIGVNRVGDRLGWQTIQQEIDRKNLHCSFMACAAGAASPHPDPKIQEFIEVLWSRRADCRTNTNVNLSPLIKKTA